MFIRNKRKLKFIHINCQSLNKKRDTLNELMGDLGENTIYKITETWLGELDEAKLWEKYENLNFFEVTGNRTLKSAVGA